MSTPDNKVGPNLGSLGRLRDSFFPGHPLLVHAFLLFAKADKVDRSAQLAPQPFFDAKQRTRIYWSEQTEHSQQPSEGKGGGAEGAEEACEKMMSKKTQKNGIKKGTQKKRARSSAVSCETTGVQQRAIPPGFDERGGYLPQTEVFGV